MNLHEAYDTLIGKHHSFTGAWEGERIRSPKKRFPRTSSLLFRHYDLVVVGQPDFWGMDEVMLLRYRRKPLRRAKEWAYVICHMEFRKCGPRHIKR